MNHLSPLELETIVGGVTETPDGKSCTEVGDGPFSDGPTFPDYSGQDQNNVVS